jgi:hypothetical protein
MKNLFAAVVLNFSSLLALSSGANGQADLPEPCKVFPPATTAARLIVRGYLRSLDKNVAITKSLATGVIGAVSANIELPKPLDLPVFVGSEDGAVKLWGESLALPEFTGEIGFRLKKDGSVDEIRVVEKSFSPLLEKALLAAVDSARSAKVFGEIAASLPAPSVNLGFRIDAGAKPDSLSVDLFETQLPTYVPTRNVEQLPGLEDLRLSGSPKFDGEVTVEFVVDETGHVPEHTFKARAASDQTLSFSLRGAISQLRYSPAMAGQCPVFRRVQQTFVYRAGRQDGRLIVRPAGR